MYGLHFTETPVVDFETAQTSDREVITRVLLNALNQGVYSMFGGMGTLSAPMTTADLDFVISAIENGLREGYGR
jgi:glutamate-1-semialdehyde aminotransferase